MSGCKRAIGSEEVFAGCPDPGSSGFAGESETVRGPSEKVEKGVGERGAVSKT